jgi:hypothetical protein
MILPMVTWGQEDTLFFFSQTHVRSKNAIIPLASPIQKLKLFASGNLDYISGGMLRSSAKVIEINVGDPEKFFLPIYIMVGALSQPTEEGLSVNYLSTADMLNRNGGLLNVGTTIDRRIKMMGKHTELKSMFQFAVKSISGVSMDTDESISLYSKIFVTGLQLDTKAWKTDDANTAGRAWLKTYLSYSMNDPLKISHIFGSESSHQFIGGNIECGLDIKSFADVRFGYHRYLNNQQIEIFTEPMYVFSANFELEKDE